LISNVSVFFVNLKIVLTKLLSTKNGSQQTRKQTKNRKQYLEEE